MADEDRDMQRRSGMSDQDLANAGAAAMVYAGMMVPLEEPEPTGTAQEESTASADSAPKPGTLGKADHQQTASEEAVKMGPNGRREVTIETPGGEKGSRRADAAKVENGRVTEVTQVIRPNKDGTAPAREVRAAKDIQNATGVKPNLVPVRPVTPPVPKPENQ